MQWEYRPEGGLGLKRPSAAKPASTHLFALRFGDGRQLQMPPAIAEDFDIIVAPAYVGFVGPALLIEAPQDGRHPGDPIHAFGRTVLNFMQGLFAVAKGDGIERVAGPQGRAPGQPPLGTPPPPHARLEEKKPRHGRTRPPPQLLFR